MSNIDMKTVAGFGDEWTTFDQSALTRDELETVFTEYFVASSSENVPLSSSAAFEGRQGSPSV